MHDTWTHRGACFRTESTLYETSRTVRLQEYVRIAQQLAELLCVRGYIEVQLCRPLTARCFYVEEWE
jgi:hypothetical protein